MKKTWTQKIDPKTEAKVVQLDRDYGGVPAGGDLFVPMPRIVSAPKKSSQLEENYGFRFEIC